MKIWLAMVMTLGAIVLPAGADVWDDLAAFTSSAEKVSPPVAVNDLIVNTPVSEMGPIEDRLIAMISSTNATLEAKQFCCRMLQRVGTEKSVPLLGGLLCDADLSHYARLTLERMTDSKAAEKVLIDALGKAPAELKIGIMGSLGVRGDQAAVKSIARYTGSDDAAVSAAALSALGKIGGKRAKNAILKSRIPDAPPSARTVIETARYDALVTIAESMHDAKLLKKIYASAPTASFRGAGLSAWVRVDASKAVPLVVALVKGEESYMRGVALTILARDGGALLTAAVAECLPELTAERQCALITLLAERGDPIALPAAALLADSEDAAVSSAACKAMAALGDGDTVALLLVRAVGERRSGIFDAVASMTHPDVDRVLLAALADKATAATACTVLGRRVVKDALPALKELTASADPQVQREAWTALGAIATVADLDSLMKMALSIEDEKLARRGYGCVLSVSAGAEDKNACIDVLGAYYDEASEYAKGFILDLAAAGGSPKGLTYVRSALASGNKTLHDKAVKALAAWAQPQYVYDDLLALAQKDPDPKSRILALRGYIAQGGKERNADKCLALLTKAVELADRPEEKRLIIAAANRRTETVFVPLILACMALPGVEQEARLALLNQAERLSEEDDVPEGVREALNVIVNDSASDAKRVERAKGVLSKLWVTEVSD